MATEVSAPVTTRTPRNPRRTLGYNTKWAIGMTIVAIIVFIAYQWIIPNTSQATRDFFRHWLPLVSINEALVWVVCALGLNVVVGYAGLLDLGFVAFWAIGGYCAGWFMSSFIYGANFHLFGSVPAGSPGVHISFWLVLIIAGVVCACMGILIGAPTLRLKSDYLALVTLGFGEIIPQVFTNGDDIAGHNLTNGTRGINPVDPIQIPITGKNLGPFDYVPKYVIFAGLAAFIIFVSLRLRKGRLGRAWLAIREDELAASMMGVPLMRSKLAAYGVGAVAGGLGGVVFATHVNGVLPDRFNFSISITLLAMVVLGGMGNVWGVVIGALGLALFNSTWLPEFGDTFNSQFNTDINFPSYNFLIFGGILVLMMLFRREGLIPETRTKLLLREPSRTEAESLGADVDEVAP
jgi:branched-chain amino acid transport system permease protein